MGRPACVAMNLLARAIDVTRRDVTTNQRIGQLGPSGHTERFDFVVVCAIRAAWIDQASGVTRWSSGCKGPIHPDDDRQRPLRLSKARVRSTVTVASESRYSGSKYLAH
jgi:hypothetical protein